MMFTEIDQSQTGNLSQCWTQEALDMAVSCLKFLQDWYVCQWIQVIEEQEWANNPLLSLGRNKPEEWK